LLPSATGARSYWVSPQQPLPREGGFLSSCCLQALAIWPHAPLDPDLPPPNMPPYPMLCSQLWGLLFPPLSSLPTSSSSLRLI
jgi:hypothetical protein